MDTADSVCPSRVHAMFASRACRSSVMIGDALGRNEMQKVLLVLHILFPPWYSIIYEKQVVFNVCSIVCVDFLHCFFLFLVFLMIIFCRMPLINLNLGISIKLTKLSWPFFPPVFFLSQILEHLVDLKSPWNCPHGRPTMRHLIDMSSIYERPDETEAALWWTFQWHLLLMPFLT